MRAEGKQPRGRGLPWYTTDGMDILGGCGVGQTRIRLRLHQRIRERASAISRRTQRGEVGGREERGEGGGGHHQSVEGPGGRHLVNKQIKGKKTKKLKKPNFHQHLPSSRGLQQLPDPGSGRGREARLVCVRGPTFSSGTSYGHGCRDKFRVGPSKRSTLTYHHHAVLFVAWFRFLPLF